MMTTCSSCFFQALSFAGQYTKALLTNVYISWNCAYILIYIAILILFTLKNNNSALAQIVPTDNRLVAPAVAQQDKMNLTAHPSSIYPLKIMHNVILSMR